MMGEGRMLMLGMVNCEGGDDAQADGRLRAGLKEK